MRAARSIVTSWPENFADTDVANAIVSWRFASVCNRNWQCRSFAAAIDKATVSEQRIARVVRVEYLLGAKGAPHRSAWGNALGTPIKRIPDRRKRDSVTRAFSAAVFSNKKVLGPVPQAGDDDAPVALEAIRIAD